MIVLDGPVGTRLEAMGVPTPAPLWTAAAIRTAPDRIAALHREYAAAGATVHTAATFRTTRRAAGAGWRELAREAVDLARGAVPAGHRVAGSIAPLEDCWHPERSPADPGPEHRALAEHLAACGVDLLLVETFANVGEAAAAVVAAACTGLPVWIALTAGPGADLLDPDAMRDGAIRAIAAGAEAVLVNCTPATATGRYVRALADLGVPFGAYANAGPADHRLGDGVPGGADRYASLVDEWIAAGASIVGGCCGTGAEHIARVADRARRV